MDVGSNSMLLTVVDDQGKVLHDEARVVGLGKGLGDGGDFLPDRMQLARQTFQDYARRAGELGVSPGDIRVCATSGARRARNAPDFFAAMNTELGLVIRTVSGEEEARLSFLGASWGETVRDGPQAVVDLGGGSTEVVIGSGGRILWRRSLEVGSVRLTEAWLGLERPSSAQVGRLDAAVQAAFESLPALTEPPRTVAVAGTATTLAAIDLGLSAFDAQAIHGHRLTPDALDGLRAGLIQATPDQRRQLAECSPKRADYLIAGATVLRAALRFTGGAALHISTRGLRFGLLHQDAGPSWG